MPALHPLQDEEPAVDHEPELQETQLLLDVVPIVVENVVEEHTLHYVDPDNDWYVPALQDRHVLGDDAETAVE